MRKLFAIRYPFLYSRLLTIIRKIIKFVKPIKCESPKLTEIEVQCGSHYEKNKKVENSSCIFFCIYWLKPSGAEYYALECAKTAKQNGMEIVWIVDFPSNNNDKINSKV